MNNRNSRISDGVFQSISRLRANNEFDDFKVNIDGESHSCHSFILASCSEFFAGLLRTDMKEKQEMVVDLKNISSSIFQLVLDSLYTGCELLTNENVLEVWSAVHQLQIHFLIEHCEDFIKSHLSLDTVGIYKQQADYLQSVRICEYIFNFTCKHFENFRKTEAMLHLNYEDLMDIITSDKLEVKFEDEILYSIFDWVSNGDAIERYTEMETVDAKRSTTKDATSSEFSMELNNKNSHNSSQSNKSTGEKELSEALTYKSDSNKRKKFLVPLLKATRYYLASEFCITLLYDHELTQNDMKAKDIFLEALAYKSSGYWHDFCPISALHRDCSHLKHVGVFCNYYDGVSALCFKRNERFSITKLPLNSNILPYIGYTKCNLAVHNGELYACISSIQYTYRCLKVPVIKHTQNGWESVTNLRVRFNDMFVSNDKYLYCFSWTGLIRFNPNIKPIEVESVPFRFQNPQHAFSFYKSIVLFCSEENNGIVKTAVYSWNTETQVCTQLDSIEFLSENMVSFRKGSKTYILDSAGNLFKMTHTETINIGFAFVKKLWSETYVLNGAFLFDETLLIANGSFRDNNELIEVEGVFSSIRFCNVSIATSNFVHFEIPTNMLTPTVNNTWS